MKIDLFGDQSSENLPPMALAISPEQQVLHLLELRNQSRQTIDRIIQNRISHYCPGFVIADDMDQVEIVFRLLKNLLLTFPDHEVQHMELHQAIHIAQQVDAELPDPSDIKRAIKINKKIAAEIDYDRYRQAFAKCFSTEAVKARKRDFQIRELIDVFGLNTAEIKSTSHQTSLISLGYVRLFGKRAAILTGNQFSLKDALESLIQIFGQAGLHQDEEELSGIFKGLQILAFRDLPAPYKADSGNTKLTIYLNAKVELKISLPAARALQTFLAKGEQ